jgi:hypothetical protein
MLIRFRSLHAGDPYKCVTAKIFPAQADDHQKINIDGAVSREEAEEVYWWLNRHLRLSGAIFHLDYFSDDDEFSYTSSESSSDSELGLSDDDDEDSAAERGGAGGGAGGGADAGTDDESSRVSDNAILESDDEE